MKIGIIGANGFLGKELCNILSKNYDIIKITKMNYNDKRLIEYDVLINANGNSRKYWAEENPYDDFLVSVESVNKSIKDFKYNLYIYISSIDVIKNTFYGLHKFWAESLVIEQKKPYLILRCSSLIGKNMKKGVIKDIIENKPLYISSDSNLQFITNTEVAKIINKLIKEKIENKIYNVAGKGFVKIKDLENIFNKEFEYNEKVEKQNYNVNVKRLDKIYKLKTSLEYIKEIL